MVAISGKISVMKENAEQIQVGNYWLDQAAKKVVERFSHGEIIVASGISPSASYHIGHFREVLTTDALAWAVRQQGREARHLHFVDNFDPLRKRYAFLPEEYEKYVGWPICFVPDHFGCHTSFATHFAEEFKVAAREMGVEMEVIYSYEDQYKTGKMAPYIEAALAKIPEIKRIMKEISHRDLPEGWAPIQILADSQSFNEWRYVSHDTATKTLRYRRADDSEGEMRYDDGRVKLNWRLDWPARWAMWGVRVEPFGKEHATRGGSYDTGEVLVKEIFDAPAPLPVPYDTINLIGETKKMSSSLGNLVTPAEALEIMPPEILRYFVLRSIPKRILYFDPGLGLYNLIDEFAKLEDEVARGEHPEFEQAYGVATAISSERTISRVPFSHLVTAYQIHNGDIQKIVDFLRKTGFSDAAENQLEVISRELIYVGKWLDKYAPDSVKIVYYAYKKGEVNNDFCLMLLKYLKELNLWADQEIHNAIYRAAVDVNMKPKVAFKLLYLMFFGKESGPRLGTSLAGLGRRAVCARLNTEFDSGSIKSSFEVIMSNIISNMAEQRVDFISAGDVEFTEDISEPDPASFDSRKSNIYSKMTNPNHDNSRIYSTDIDKLSLKVYNS